jgi:pyruvate dehydrogenase E1 component
MGVSVVETCAAHDELTAEGIETDLVVLTSADLVFRALRARAGLAEGEDAILEALFPAERAAPIVAVLDGHPHALSFLSSVHGVPIATLGVDDFGQSGDVADLYRKFGIDPETIVGAAIDLLP